MNGPDGTKEAPGGYLSEESKRRFTITAGVLGAVFLIAQFAVPFVTVLSSMPFMMFSGSAALEMAETRRSAFWNGRVWYVARSVSMRPSNPERITLNALDLQGDREPESVAELPLSNPWLLPDWGRLWIISSSAVGYFSDGKITWIEAIDGFFNFMVGIMVVALSENWQRVGDMAARTVVVLADSVHVQGSRSEDYHLQEGGQMPHGRAQRRI